MAKNNKKVSDSNLDDDVEPTGATLDEDLNEEDDEEDLDSWELEEDMEE